MTKTKRQIQSSLKLVDAVAEIIDARIPVSSRNPDLAKLVQNKPRVILSSINAIWLIKLLRKCGLTILKSRISLLSRLTVKAAEVLTNCTSVNTVMSHKIARLKEKEW